MATALVLLLAVSALTSTGTAEKHDLIMFESDQGTGPNARVTAETIFLKEVGTSKHTLIIREQYAETIKLGGKVDDTPIEYMSDKMRRLGVPWPDDEREITNVNLTFVKITPSLKGQTMAQYQSAYRSFGTNIGPILWPFPHRAFNSKGSFPQQMIVLINLPIEKFDRVYLEILDIFGGPGECSIDASYVEKL